MSSAICFNLDQSKILSCGNGLKGKPAQGQITIKGGTCITKKSIYQKGNVYSKDKYLSKAEPVLQG